MYRIHILENNKVVNTVVVDVLKPYMLNADEVGGGIGWTWDGEQMIPPEPEPIIIPVPPAVTMRQARLALLSVGLLDDVEAAINSLPSPQKEAARIEWEYSQEVQRHNGFVSILAPSLGLTEESLDNLFIEAAKL